MAITQRQIDQIYSDLKGTYGGVKEDYFALLYLQQEFSLPTDVAASQIAFGGNDYGIDAFHIDVTRRNLYLYQFKWSTSSTLFKQSFQRLIQAGMERIFGSAPMDQRANDILLQLHTRLMENQAAIDRVCIHFVFNGDPAEAERSKVLENLQEDLEAKNYLINEWFGRPMTMICEFRSPAKRGAAAHTKKTHTYDIELESPLEARGPQGEKMQVGFVRLADIHGMYKEMGQRFFERNIRATISKDEAPNRAIMRTLRQVVITEKESPAAFAFNHNGITLSAERADHHDGKFVITEPRLLNGAQTVSTYDQFLKDNETNPVIRKNGARLREIRVLCKMITESAPEFVVAVTVNNNRQNPVMPWNLRANDPIQLELQDKFRDDLGIFYERQENAFANLSQDDLDEMDISETRAVELLKLCKTFLAADGQIDKFSNIRDVFENDKTYDQVYSDGRLRADCRHILLCYKVQFRLSRMIRDIKEHAGRKYYYISKARNLIWALVCQGILNDAELEDKADRFGRGLAIEAEYTDWIARLANGKARVLIGEVVEKEPYATSLSEDRLSFLRTQALYEKCMDVAYKKWRWMQKRLRQGARGAAA